ncbi:MAG: hypothetical protein U1D30_27040 [Planctomycetota bacterium]
MRHPKFSVSFEELPSDPKERHEALVDLFGEYVLWVREQAISRIRRLVESEEERNKLGTLFRDVFEDAANLPVKDRIIALRLVESAIGNFAGLFLTMMSGQGFDDSLGPNHVFRYRLDMEVCDVEKGEVVYEETINRGGKKFFPEYWGRWLNKYRELQAENNGEATGNITIP